MQLRRRDCVVSAVSVEAGIEVELDVDLDKPLICEVVWATENTRYLCGRTATWQGMAHDEVEDHDYTRILLCKKCKNLALIKNPCECGAVIITDLRKI